MRLNFLCLAYFATLFELLGVRGDLMGQLLKQRHHKSKTGLAERILTNYISQPKWVIMICLKPIVVVYNHLFCEEGSK